MDEAEAHRELLQAIIDTETEHIPEHIPPADLEPIVGTAAVIYLDAQDRPVVTERDQDAWIVSTTWENGKPVEVRRVPDATAN